MRNRLEERLGTIRNPKLWLDRIYTRITFSKRNVDVDIWSGGERWFILTIGWMPDVRQRPYIEAHRWYIKVLARPIFFSFYILPHPEDEEYDTDEE